MIVTVASAGAGRRVHAQLRGALGRRPRRALRAGRAAAGTRRQRRACGRGSAPTTASRSRTGSRSTSARRSGGSGSRRRCSPRARSSARSPRWRRSKRCELAGVVDETQLDEVYHQWLTQRRQRLEGAAAAERDRARPSSPESSRRRGRPRACTTTCTRRSWWPTTSSFVGSFNLSRSGERNAENVLELHDSETADRLATYIDTIRAVYPRSTVPLEAQNTPWCRRPPSRLRSARCHRPPARSHPKRETAWTGRSRSSCSR